MGFAAPFPDQLCAGLEARDAAPGQIAVLLVLPGEGGMTSVPTERSGVDIAAELREMW